jgi:hypothetical protein
VFQIRLDTAEGTHKRTRAVEEAVNRDLKTRRELTESVMADQTYLRFRLPWPVHGQSNKIEYLKADMILKNVYGNPNSSEVDMMIRRPQNGVYTVTSWDETKMQDIMFRHNQVERVKENFDEEASDQIWMAYLNVSTQYMGTDVYATWEDIIKRLKLET